MRSVVAAWLGTVHAAWSAYWAFGGELLLETVGQWAVEAAREGSMAVAAGLLAVALAKLAGAWVPLLAETGRIPGRRLWRLLAWVGGLGLIVYGGANAIAGMASLAGWVDVEITDRQAVVGHAFLWGPHFALWGVALTAGLLLSRRDRSSGRR